MKTKSLSEWLMLGILIILALMPFHTLIVVWAGHLLGHQVIFQAWKELLIVVLFCLSLIVIIKNPQVKQKLLHNYNYLILAFCILALLINIANHPSLLTLVYGIKYTLGYLLLFVITQIAATSQNEKIIIRIILATVAVVVGFGLLQIFLLPHNFLANFGYSQTTVAPYLGVPGTNAIRILSTLGGPNQLGSFLLLPICLLVYLIIKKQKLWYFILLASSIVVLFNTFSRSAWLGAILAVVVTMLLALPRTVLKWSVLVFISIALGCILLISVNSRLQFYLFHGNSTTYLNDLKTRNLNSSDAKRLTSMRDGLEMIVKYPFGKGLGTAGPASVKTNNGFLTENYYIQIAIEAGILGLIIYLLIQISVGISLYRIKNSSPLAVALIGSLTGMAVINLFLHGWADSSTALIWWSTAGLVIGAHS